MNDIKETIRLAMENVHSTDLNRNQFNISQYTSSYKPGTTSSYKSKYSFNPDLDTSDGLYMIAKDAGLQSKADNVILNNSGEKIDKIFSGGFVSDIFDVVNLTSYGMNGLLKGEGVIKGIDKRSSFSDKDYLGQYGLGGVISGLILDIAVDPSTYIAPWTKLSKVSGITHLISKGVEGIVGKQVTKIGIGAEQSFQTLEGGIANGKARSMIQKVAYVFGVDPIFKDAHDSMISGIASGVGKSMSILKEISLLDTHAAGKLLVRDTKGRWDRANIDDLQRTLTTEDFDSVKPIWDKIDEYGKEMVDLKLLGKDTYEKGVGSYIKNAYADYELAASKNSRRSGKIGIKGIKSRSETLTREGMEKLRQIDNPQYLLGITMTNMIRDIETAKFFKKVAKFSSDVEQEGFVKVPEISRFQVSTGANAEARAQVAKLNEQVIPLLKELKQTFKADSATMKEINSMEKELSYMNTLRGSELSKYISDIGTLVPKKDIPRKLGVIPERLLPLANSLKKFKTYEEMIVTRAGIQLEKLWYDGVLDRNGFPGGEKAMRKFFETVKNPYKPSRVSSKEEMSFVTEKGLVDIQKRIEKLTSSSKLLRDIDKKSINDSFINLEKNINEIRMQKDDLIEQLHMNKLSDLAGRYIPKEMFDYIDEVINPSTPAGSQIITQFKYMHVILSPATHVRNVLSNQILNWWKLGIGPWRLDLNIKAANEIKNNGKFWQEFSSVGGGQDTFAAEELRALLGKYEMAPELGSRNFLVRGVKGIEKKLVNVYQWEETQAKMSAFIYLRRKGHSIEEAFKGAQSATFNYAQVTPFIRQMRSSIFGMPFITFSLKSAPIALEALIKNPQRISVFGKIRNSLFDAAEVDETTQELSNEPPWIRDGFFMKLPWKDEQGRSMFFDLTYVIPFGDLVSGNILQTQTRRETGTKEALALSIASVNPAFNILKELSRNETFSGNKIFLESDGQFEVGADIMKYLLKQALPPPLASQLSDGYNKFSGVRQGGGIQKSLGDVSGTNKRNVWEEIGSYLGMKVQPMDADLNEVYKELNIKKGLETLVRENTNMRGFNRNYIPDEGLTRPNGAPIGR